MITEDGLKWRKKSEKELSRFFGTEITIELSDMFKLENEVIKENIESINPETENETVSRETNDTESETEKDGETENAE